MIRLIKKYAASFSYVIGLALIAAVVGGYILSNQRLRIPLLDDKPVLMKAELPNAQAVTPGQGQSVQVAGVKIGQIAGVELRDGRAVLDLEIEPKFRDLIRTDAKAQLRPRTGLKDMYLQIAPGKGPEAPEGFEVPVARTLTDVDLDEILEGLDDRTQDYVTLLAKGAGDGLDERGGDLAEVFQRFGPTARDLATVSRAVTERRGALKRLITSIGTLNSRLADNPQDLTQLVDASARTFDAFAAQDADLRATVQELPDTLRRASATLQAVRPFAEALGPATRELTPVLGPLTRSSRQAASFARSSLAPVRDQIRPFTREAQPLVEDLRPAATSLRRVAPELTRVGTVLNHLFNMAAHNPEGREAPDKAGREEGFLFWLAWATHNTTNLFNIDDANGPMRPIFLTGTCGTLASVADIAPQLEAALGLSPLLASLCNDPQTTSVDAAARAKLERGGETAADLASEVRTRAVRRAAR